MPELIELRQSRQHPDVKQRRAKPTARQGQTHLADIRGLETGDRVAEERKQYLPGFGFSEIVGRFGTIEFQQLCQIRQLFRCRFEFPGRDLIDSLRYL